MLRFGDSTGPCTDPWHESLEAATPITDDAVREATWRMAENPSVPDAIRNAAGAVSNHLRTHASAITDDAAQEALDSFEADVVMTGRAKKSFANLRATLTDALADRERLASDDTVAGETIAHYKVECERLRDDLRMARVKFARIVHDANAALLRLDDEERTYGTADTRDTDAAEMREGCEE